MDFFVPATKATIKDRFVAAYYAFRQRAKPDVAAALERMSAMAIQRREEEDAREAKRRTAVERLEPFSRALITSIAGATDNSDRLLEQVMPHIEQLDIEDQLTIVRHIVRGNPRAALSLPMRNWAQRHVRDIITNLPE